MGEMLDSDWSRKILLRSDWSGLIGAPITTGIALGIGSLVQSIHLSLHYIKIVSLLSFHLLLHAKYSVSFARNRDSEFFGV